MTSATKETIHRIWGEVLQKDNLDSDQSFFELGGNSMMLMNVQVEMEKAFSCKLSVPDFFSFPTIDKMSEYIDSICVKK